MVGNFYVPAWASGRASMQEMWGSSKMIGLQVNVNRESMNVTSVDTSTESRFIGPTSETGYPQGP